MSFLFSICLMVLSPLGAILLSDSDLEPGVVQSLNQTKDSAEKAVIYSNLISVFTPDGQDPFKFSRHVFRAYQWNIHLKEFDKEVFFKNSPCSPKELDCWQTASDSVDWIRTKTAQYHQLLANEGDSLVSNRFENEIGLLDIPVIAEYLAIQNKLQLIDAYHSGQHKLFELQERLVSMIVELSAFEPEEALGVIDHLLQIIIRRKLIENLVFSIQLKSANSVDIVSIPSAEFDVREALENAYFKDLKFVSELHFNSLFSTRNRTLNRAYACVIMITRLGDRRLFDYALFSGFESCEDLPFRWWNFVGDHLAHDLLAVDLNHACMFHSANDEMRLLKAVFDAEKQTLDIEQKNQFVESTNRYHPEYGITFSENKICYETPEAFKCGKPCVPSIWAQPARQF